MTLVCTQTTVNAEHQEKGFEFIENQLVQESCRDPVKSLSQSPATRNRSAHVASVPFAQRRIGDLHHLRADVYVEPDVALLFVSSLKKHICNGLRNR